MTEEEYIKQQGNVPLKNNLIRRLVNTVLGVYRQQAKEPICTARDRDEQKLGETMSTILQCNMQLNRMSDVYARTMEEYLISGLAVHRKWFGWRNDKLDCWTDYVQPNNFFIDSNMRDFRGWDCNFIGEVHDMSYETLLQKYAESPADVERLKNIYHDVLHATMFPSLPSGVVIHALPTSKPMLAMSVDGVRPSLSCRTNPCGIPLLKSALSHVVCACAAWVMARAEHIIAKKLFISVCFCRYCLFIIFLTLSPCFTMYMPGCCMLLTLRPPRVNICMCSPLSKDASAGLLTPVVMPKPGKLPADPAQRRFPQLRLDSAQAVGTPHGAFPLPKGHKGFPVLGAQDFPKVISQGAGQGTVTLRGVCIHLDLPLVAAAVGARPGGTPECIIVLGLANNHMGPPFRKNPPGKMPLPKTRQRHLLKYQPGAPYQSSRGFRLYIPLAL